MSQFSDNHYARLGLPFDATKDEIRLAYHDAARRLHPDTNKEADATEQFLAVQRAFDVLSNPADRKDYDATLPRQADDAVIKIASLYSRKALTPTDEPQLVYIMLDVSVEPGKAKKTSPPLNVCILIDRSTSMKGERIDTVRATARKIISQLRPEDYVSVVAFNDRAEVVVPPERNIDGNKVQAQISQIQTGGGTEMYQGLRAAYQQVSRNLRMSQINHIILVTDGHTYGDEARCLELAGEARDAGIAISALGIGSEWNDDFLDALASRTGGNSMYIAFARDIKRFLELKFADLNNVVAENLALVRPDLSNGAELRYAFRIHPDPTRLDAGPKISLGNVRTNETLRVLLEFIIKDVTLPAEQVNLIKGTLRLELPERLIPTVRKYVDWALPVSEDPTTHPSPPDIVQAMSRLTLYRMQEQARVDLADGNVELATRRLQNLATHLLAQGEHQLASMILKEATLVESGTRNLDDLEKKIKYGTRALLLPPPA